jgi:hypothetical protein
MAGEDVVAMKQMFVMKDTLGHVLGVAPSLPTARQCFRISWGRLPGELDFKGDKMVAAGESEQVVKDGVGIGSIDAVDYYTFPDHL